MTHPNIPGTGGQGNPGTGAGNGQQGQGNDPSAGGGAGTGLSAEEQLAMIMAANSGTPGTSGTGSEGSGGSGAQGTGTENLTPEERLERAEGRATELQRRARDLEKQNRTGAAAIRRLQEIEDANKTATELAQARAVQAEAAAAEAQAGTHRLLAAARHGLGPEAIDFLGSGTEEEIGSRAESLMGLIQAEAARMLGQVPGQQGLPGVNGQGQPQQRQQPFPANRPVASLRPGGTPADQTGNLTGEEAFREMIGNRR